jgi:hypothetical protein
MEINIKSITSAHWSAAVFVILLSAGCSSTKYVPANDALYTGASFKLENAKASKTQNKVLKSDLERLLRPRPNSRILGIPFKLLIYNMAGKKNNFINRFLKKTGEPPVLLSRVNVSKNVQVLTNTLENRGFFHAKARGDTAVKNKKASASYVANAGVHYKINEVHFPDDTSAISKAIRDVSSESMLKKGDPFNLDVIKGERLRIDVALKERGFYYFSPDHLIVRVDSTNGSDLANLYVNLSLSTTPAQTAIHHQRYLYYSNYNFSTAARDTLKQDTLLYKGISCNRQRKTFKPLFSNR